MNVLQKPAYEWRNSLFVGGLKDRRLVRLESEDGRVTGEEHLLAGRGRRLCAVRQGPDGAPYLVIDEKDPELRKIVSRG